MFSNTCFSQDETLYFHDEDTNQEISLKISNVDILKLFLIANSNKKVLLMTTFEQSHFFAFVLLQLTTSKTFQYGSEGSKLESKGF